MILKFIMQGIIISTLEKEPMLLSYCKRKQQKTALIIILGADFNCISEQLNLYAGSAIQDTIENCIANNISIPPHSDIPCTKE